MHRLRILALTLVTLVCLGWALWGMDLVAVGHALGSFRPVMLVPALALSAVAIMFRAFRFACLLDAPRRTFELVSPMQVGFLAISVIPLRMGEFVRPFLLAERHGVPFGAGMAAVVLERLLDMSALLLLLTYVAWFVHVPHQITVSGVDLLVAGQRAMGIGVVVGGVGVAGLAAAGPSGVVLLARVVGAVSPRLAPPVTRLAGTLVDGLRALFQRPLAALGAVAGTAGMWFASIALSVVVMAGFDGLPVGFDVAAVNNASTVTALALIPTPGFVGAWEAGAYSGLIVYDVDADVARAFALTHHAFSFAFNVVVGLAFLARQGRSLGDLVRASNERAKE